MAELNDQKLLQHIVEVETAKRSRYYMLRAFTRNYEDNSSEDGFQFTFYCDSCLRGFQSSYIKSVSYEKIRNPHGLRKYAKLLKNIFSGIFTRSREKAANKPFKSAGMISEWHREHEKAFEIAQGEIRTLLRRCNSCDKYLCEACFHEDKEMCSSCDSPLRGDMRKQLY